MTETIRINETTEIDVTYRLGERKTYEEPGTPDSAEVVAARMLTKVESDFGDLLPKQWINVTDVLDAFGVDLFSMYEAKIHNHFRTQL